MVYNRGSSKRSRATSGSTTEDDLDYHPNMENKSQRKPTRVPKCFSRNALMARENRLKKKLYISQLEDERSILKEQNKKLSTIVENQSHLIQELRREIKYLKSVVSNSDGIGKLIKNINLTTGMPVTMSIKKTPVVNETYKPEIAKKTAHPWDETVKTHKYENNFIKEENLETNEQSRHPWEETKYCKESFEQQFPSLPTPESTHSYYSSPDFDDLNSDCLLDDLDMPIDITDNELLNILDEQSLDTTLLPLDDHNYHYQPKQEEQVSNQTKVDDNVGVCLHVSNNKVSLEFCQNCSENAQQAWKAQT